MDSLREGHVCVLSYLHRSSTLAKVMFLMAENSQNLR